MYSTFEEVLKDPGIVKYPYICRLRSTGEYFLPSSIDYAQRRVTFLFKDSFGILSSRVFDYCDVIFFQNYRYKEVAKKLNWSQNILLDLFKHLEEFGNIYSPWIVLEGIKLHNQDHAEVIYKEVKTGFSRVLYVRRLQRFPTYEKTNYVYRGQVREKQGVLGKLVQCYRHINCDYSFDMSGAIVMYLGAICNLLQRKHSTVVEDIHMVTAKAIFGGV